MEGPAVKSGPRPKRRRRCAHCRRPFIVDPRVVRRHRFCSRKACARASQRTSQQKWLNSEKGKGYFSGKENSQNVRDWRQLHPQYWKRTRRFKDRRSGKTRLIRQLAAALKCVALQDVIDPRPPLKIRIDSRLSGAALQEEIARKIRAIILRGHANLRRHRIPKTR